MLPLRKKLKVRKSDYLVFRPYEGQMRPELPSDCGYYFKMQNCDVKIIRHTLEHNGFRDMKI